MRPIAGWRRLWRRARHRIQPILANERHRGPAVGEKTIVKLLEVELVSFPAAYLFAQIQDLPLAQGVDEIGGVRGPASRLALRIDLCHVAVVVKEGHSLFVGHAAGMEGDP